MNWTGRLDGEDPLYHRIFQKVIVGESIEEITENSFVLHGFAVDEGVKRNKGRVGAAKAPDVIRKNMCNFPVIHSDFKLFDCGNIECENNNLEQSQGFLAEKVCKILQKKAKSIVLGGGHEVTFAHYSGIKQAFPNKKIGIINFDAHFDNRAIENGVGATSGTGFWQIAQEGNLHSLHIGIQRNSNTLQLFRTADQFGMQSILADELYYENLPNLYSKTDDFLKNIDVSYVTICMDVFNSAIASGVSAPSYNGIFADPTFMQLYRTILKSEKLIALDIAEVNPELDFRDQTARLAASLVNEWFMLD